MEEVKGNIVETYLDNCATTRVYPEVAELVTKVMLNSYGNPSSLHRKGIEAENIVKTARRQIARVLAVEPETIVFTSGGTEANNLALVGAARARRRKGTHIICSAIEHPSVLDTIKKLGEEGYNVDFCPVNNQGYIEAKVLADLVQEDTILVSIMAVNNEIGTIQSIPELVQACREKNPEVNFHTDCVQAFGKIEVHPREWGVNMVTISSHKIHGPKGVGGVYVARGTKLESLLAGGGQENKMRAGTENVPGIAGFGLAAQLAGDNLSRMLDLVSLKQRLVNGLDQMGINYLLNGPAIEKAAPHVINISFPGLKGETILHCLEGNGVYVSTGAACSSKKTKASHVLTAIGRTEDEAEGSIRVSFSNLNSNDDVDRLIEALASTMQRLKPVSRQ
ncbi:MAG: cysteine desulfurase family protein [Methanomassiliicoccales archaeon]